MDALLCCSAKASSSETVPKEQQINVEKLRPGSGMLLVKVLADGPTRALRISDVRQQVLSSRFEQRSFVGSYLQLVYVVIRYRNVSDTDLGFLFITYTNFALLL